MAQRTQAESRRREATAEGAVLIDKFLARTLRYNQLRRAIATRRGLPLVTISPDAKSGELLNSCLSYLK